MAVCTAWRRAAREKLQEWSIIETEGKSHAVRGLKGKSMGKLRAPSSIAVLPDRSIGVVDFHNRRIQVLAPAAMELESSSSHSADGSCPRVAFRASDIVKTLVAGTSPFVGPTSAIADGRGHLLVADNQTHTLYRLALDGERAGTVLARSGGHGRERDQLWDPEGLALDEDGLLYVADSGNHRVVVFKTRPDSSGSASPGGSSDGGGVRSGGGGEDGEDGGALASSGASGEELTPLRSFGKMGFGDGQLSSPYGVAVAPRADGGHVYVADTLGSRICVFDRSGLFIRSIGQRASGPERARAPGAFHLPRSLCVVRGHLIVVEERRLQVLTLDGSVRQIIEFGAGPDGLAPAVASSGVHAGLPPAPASPTHAGGDGPPVDDEAGLWGVAADDERVFVSDSRRHRLHLFKLKRYG